MTPSDLIALGHYLHGTDWQARLARDLLLTEPAIQLWLDGRFNPTADNLNDLLTLVAARYVEEQVTKAAAAGLWGAGTLVLKAQHAPWSIATDRTIKALAAEILRELGLDAGVAENPIER